MITIFILDGSIDEVILLQINSCGESWDSSCEQTVSPTPEPLSSSSKHNKS